MKLYADRDVEKLGEHYTAHVDAMTREGLHSKSDIAAELAWRDRGINSLANQVETLTAESRRLHREMEAAREQSDHGGYCNLHGRHLGYKCPECPYEDRIAELERELEAARALIERKDASMKQDADVFCAHTDMNVKRLAELEHQLAGFRWHPVSEGLPESESRFVLGFMPWFPGGLECAFTMNRRDEQWRYVTHWREIGELPSALPTGASAEFAPPSPPAG